MKIISIFNNKGGVGKSTLSFHLAHALAELGYKTILVDLDPQSNLTLQCMEPKRLESIWLEEEPYIDDFQAAIEKSGNKHKKLNNKVRSIHYLLKPIEDGVYDSFSLGTIYKLSDNLGLIPGRLSLHTFEDKLAKSWSEAFMGEPQALRLISSIRSLCLDAAQKDGYTIAILDTSPSLGMLNRIIISTSTGFFVPCMPDMFSTFGIKNIGRALRIWRSQFETMYNLLSDRKRNTLPKEFVKFLGYTIYNAKKYAGQNDLDIATAHYGYAKQLPTVIRENIPSECYSHLGEGIVETPIGGKSIMHSHNTMTSMSQKYRTPIWLVPDSPVAREDKSTISGNKRTYINKKSSYHDFAKDLVSRLTNIVD